MRMSAGARNVLPGVGASKEHARLGSPDHVREVFRRGLAHPIFLGTVTRSSETLTERVSSGTVYVSIKASCI
jgi:hypothetical protein